MEPASTPDDTRITRIPLKVRWGLVFLLFLLAACLPASYLVVGAPTIGVLSANIDSDTPLIIDINAPAANGYVHMYKSIDGGLTWKGFGPGKRPQHGDVDWVETECTSSCEFVDPVNKLIQYRILPGKYLYRSMDGGLTWSDELHIPAWNQMQQTYVKTKFYSFSSPTVERGPFSAVTDPKTGNIVLTMGLEGLLVRTPNGQVHRPRVPYAQNINPGRSEMLGLIEKQEWWRGPVIALLIMLIGLYRSGLRRFGKAARYLMALAGFLIVIPYYLLITPLLWLIPSTTRPVDALEPILYAFISLTIILPMIAIILVNLFKVNSSNRPPLLPLAAVSAGTMIGYWLPFIAWSQGVVLVKYESASGTGIALILITIALTDILIKNRSFAKPPLDPSTAVR